ITYATGTGSYPYSVAVVDVNSDTKPDIIVANKGLATVGVLLNTGSGTFLTQITYATGTGSRPYSVAVVDVNNDNKPDIIVADANSNTIYVLLNAGSGTFLNQTTYATGTQPYSVAVADVNNDNKPDIIVGNYGLNTVSVFLHC
ncbi:unnamed protein product, partial [Rotaria magnacalcarata]